MRKFASIILLVIVLVSMTACYDAIEVDDMVHVIAIGIDKGAADKWRITLQYPTMKSGVGGGQSQAGDGADQEEYSYVSVDAPSFFTGINMLNVSIPRKLNFMHAHIIVFSSELAKEGLIGECIDSLYRSREIRKTAHIFLSQGKAADLIKEIKPVIGSSIPKSFQLLVDESANTGFFPHVTIENFYESLNSTYRQAIIPMVAVNDMKSVPESDAILSSEYKTGGDYTAGQIPRTGKNVIEMWGTAVFNGEKMIEELNGDETRYLLLIRGEFERGSFSFPDPQKPDSIISLDVRRSEMPHIRVRFEGATPIIELKVNLDADLLAVQSGINYAQPKLKAILEETVNQQILDGIGKLISKYKDLNVDIFGFGDYAARNFLTIDEWEAYSWNNVFKESIVTIEVCFAIRRTGTQIKSDPTVDTEGMNK